MVHSIAPIGDARALPAVLPPNLVLDTTCDVGASPVREGHLLLELGRLAVPLRAPLPSLGLMRPIAAVQVRRWAMTLDAWLGAPLHDPG
eukprot:5983570-Alexandrium_andersonii.AAC.1